MILNQAKHSQQETVKQQSYQCYIFLSDHLVLVVFPEVFPKTENVNFLISLPNSAPFSQRYYSQQFSVTTSRSFHMYLHPYKYIDTLSFQWVLSSYSCSATYTCSVTQKPQRPFNAQSSTLHYFQWLHTTPKHKHTILAFL